MFVVLGGLLILTVGGLVTYLAYRHRDLGVALLVGFGAVTLIIASLALGSSIG
ncbi:hypothetical protein [Streptomyces sp. st170]|uniref:hypothetical protein n=1 Tax=Streptomyces sp. st170 TaxID=1828058 RepID=UPI0015CF59C0|nr:hypothetical protein [Streptomyces sp. st170]